jgi:hypothetical protein
MVKMGKTRVNNKLGGLDQIVKIVTINAQNIITNAGTTYHGLARASLGSVGVLLEYRNVGAGRAENRPQTP